MRTCIRQIANGFVVVFGARTAYILAATSKFTAALVLFLTVGVGNSFAQTTIIVMRNATEIVAGSDSKARSPDGSTVTACKVRRVGSIFWSVSGSNSDNLAEMVTFIYKQTRTFHKTVERFSTFVPPKLQIPFDNLRKSSPRDYAWLLRHAAEGINVTFFGMERGIPMVASVAFDLKVDSRKPIIISLRKPPKFYDGAVCPNYKNVCGAATGYYEHIRSDIRAYDWHVDMAPDIRSLIQKEIDTEPVEVGPPIRILKIDRKGPHWIQNGEGCNIGNIPKD